jgi:transporter family-2 protein
MLTAGLGIPVMAALSGTLGAKLHSPALASTILIAIGLIMAATYLVATEGIPTKLYSSSIPWYFYFGGFFFVFYVLTITWIAPIYGVSNAVSFVLLGQLIAMTAIDHFGLMGAPQFTLNYQRAFGLVFMAIGIFMVVRKST